MGEIKKLIRICSSRNLTPYGKVSIMKSLLTSKITHMLLSLPIPNVLYLKELYNTFSNFLWCGNVEILEGEIHHGGLKLHNIALCDKTLKSSWLRRFLQSNRKRIDIPKSFEWVDAFTFGPVYLDRIIEVTANKFWTDVIKSTQMLCQSEAVFDKEAMCNTPLWLHNYFQLPIKRDWLDKGINSIAYSLRAYEAACLYRGIIQLLQS